MTVNPSAPTIADHSAAFDLDSLVKIATAIGGFSTAIALVAAAVAGYIAYRQLNAQTRIHWDQSYSSLFAEYVESSDALFTADSSIHILDIANYKALIKEVARVIHFMNLLTKIYERRPLSFSAVDFVFLTHDIDRISNILVRMGRFYEENYVELAVGRFEFDKIRADLGDRMTSEQDAILRGFEHQVREAAGGKTSAREDEILYNQIGQAIKTMFGHELLVKVGERSSPVMFERSRALQQYLIINETFVELSRQIHVASLNYVPDHSGVDTDAQS